VYQTNVRGSNSLVHYSHIDDAVSVEVRTVANAWSAGGPIARNVPAALRRTHMF